MPLIKRSNPSRPVEHAVVLDLGDLAAEARRLRDEARRHAQELLDEARATAAREAEAAREQAHRAGYEAGLAEGREAGRAEGRKAAQDELRSELQELVTQWTGALGQWRSQRQAMLRQAREDVLLFAIELGQRVVHRFVEVDPGIVADQLREALSLVGRPTSVEVVVHPDDRPMLEQTVPRLVAEIASCDDLRLQDDASVGRGGCIVRTSGGEVDARIETQLDRITRTLVPGGDADAADDVRPPSAEPRDGT